VPEVGPLDIKPLSLLSYLRGRVTWRQQRRTSPSLMAQASEQSDGGLCIRVSQGHGK